MEKAKDKNVKIHFPVDFVIAAAIKDDAETAVVSAKDGIPEDKMVNYYGTYLVYFLPNR